MPGLIPSLLDLLLSILEACFTSPPSAAKDHDHSTHATPEEHSAALQAAFEFFETTPQEATRESIKRKFRKLSLLHHPDRNGNSEESKHMMQKVNNYCNLINDEFDRREGASKDKDHFESDSEYMSPQYDDDDYRNDDFYDKPESAKARKRREREARQRMAKEEARMEEEMRKEWEEIKRQKKQVKREKHNRDRHIKRTVKKQGLDTKGGRDRAYQEWEQAVQDLEEQPENERENAESTKEEKPEEGCGLHDIDEDAGQDKAPKPDPSPHAVPVKPVNLVMECCTNDVAIALRMGLSDVAIDSVQEDVSHIVENEMKEAFFSGKDGVRTSDIAAKVAAYLVRPFDDDGNTLLHYAVYYENLDVISMIAYLGTTFEATSEVFLKKNVREKLPVDLAVCCYKDPAIPQRMKVWTDAAQDEMNSKKILPSLMKTAHRLWGIVRNVNVVGTANIIAAYFIGTRLFGNNRIISTLIPILVLAKSMAARYDDGVDSADKVSLMFALHMIWFGISSAFRIIPWELYFLTIPIWIFVCCANSPRRPLWLEPEQPRIDWVGILCIPVAMVAFGLTKAAHSIKIPKVVKKDEQVELSTLLLFFSLSFLLVKRGIPLFFATGVDEIFVGEADSIPGETPNPLKH